MAGGIGVTVWDVSQSFSGVEYPVADGTWDRLRRRDDRRVAFDEPLAIDRTALFAALGFPDHREIGRFERANAVSIIGTLAYPDGRRQSRSALAPNPRYDVTTIGGRERLGRLGERSPTMVTTYRVELTAVAESAEAFAATMFDRYGVDLDDRDLSTE